VIVSSQSPSFQIGPDKIRKLKIVVSEDPIGCAKDILLKAGLSNNDLNTRDVSTRFDLANLKNRLVGDSHHFDSVYKYLESSGSQFVFYAFSGDTENALAHASTFLYWYLGDLENLDSESKSRIKHEYGYALTAMENYFTAQGYDFVKMKEEHKKFKTSDERKEYIYSLMVSNTKDE
jgi:hypothetical protein